jgi:hypothetical protein
MKNQFSYEEVAFIFGVTRQTVYNWQTDGKLPAGEIDAQVIENLIESREREMRAEIDRARRRFQVLEGEPALAGI